MVNELEIKEIEIIKKSEIKYFILLQYDKDQAQEDKYFTCAISTDIDFIYKQLQWWKQHKEEKHIEFKIFSMMLPN